MHELGATPSPGITETSDSISMNLLRNCSLQLENTCIFLLIVGRHCTCAMRDCSDTGSLCTLWQAKSCLHPKRKGETPNGKIKYRTEDTHTHLNGTTVRVRKSCMLWLARCGKLSSPSPRISSFRGHKPTRSVMSP